MRCPACRTPAIEHDAACRQCGFSLEAADRTFGIPPSLQRPVADVVQALPRSGRNRLTRQIFELERRFPQVTVAVVVLEVPPQIPLLAYAFWLFNRGGLSGALEKGGQNHLVMLLIDVSGKRAAAMVGYGLEPFIQDTDLHGCLLPAQQALRRDQYGPAAGVFVRAFERRLHEVFEVLPRQFGLTEDGVWLDASAPGAALLESLESPY